MGDQRPGQVLGSTECESWCGFRGLSMPMMNTVLNLVGQIADVLVLSLAGQTPQYYPQAQQYPQQFAYQPGQPHPWMNTPTVPSNYPYEGQAMSSFPQYSEPANFSPQMTTAGPSRTSRGYLSPDEAGRSRVSRATSFASNASSVSQSDVSRSASPNAGEMAKWGVRNENGTWSCAYPGCSSRSTFNRGCDLRKHYKRHTKSLFCRHEGCPQATEGGFSSKKDRARHEAKHDPKIVCEWEGCDRLFSRVDNMVGLEHRLLFMVRS